MKAFINIIIVGLIGLCSSTYLFNLSPIDYRGSIEIETPVEESTLSLKVDETKVLNPESITISHLAQKDEVIKVVTDSIFNLDIYRDKQLIKSNVNNLELIAPSINATISASQDNPIITTLNLSQAKLKLEDGTYEFVFNSNLIADKERSKVTVTVTYDTAGQYYPAVNEAPLGTKGLTLYFTADKDDVLIPVTRFVIEDKSITRMAVEQLQNGPLNKELKSLIKNVTNTTYNNGNVVIDIPSSYEGYNQEGTGGLAYNSFLKTIFAVDRYWPIHSLTFTVDRARVESYFNGIPMNPVPNSKDNYLLYLAYKADNRYYLFEYKLNPDEIGIGPNDTIETRAQKVFEVYLKSDFPYGISPLPKTVTLNKASLQGRTLILDFNKDILNIYKDKDDLKLMMVESFAYTFTTLPGVDSIKITAAGEEIPDFVKGIDTTKAIYPPEFINPETIEEAQ